MPAGLADKMNRYRESVICDEDAFIGQYPPPSDGEESPARYFIKVCMCAQETPDWNGEILQEQDDVIAGPIDQQSRGSAIEQKEKEELYDGGL